MSTGPWQCAPLGRNLVEIHLVGVPLNRDRIVSRGDWLRGGEHRGGVARPVDCRRSPRVQESPQPRGDAVEWRLPDIGPYAYRGGDFYDRIVSQGGILVQLGIRRRRHRAYVDNLNARCVSRRDRIRPIKGQVGQFVGLVGGLLLILAA